MENEFNSDTSKQAEHVLFIRKRNWNLHLG